MLIAFPNFFSELVLPGNGTTRVLAIYFPAPALVSDPAFPYPSCFPGQAFLPDFSVIASACERLHTAARAKLQASFPIRFHKIWTEGLTPTDSFAPPEERNRLVFRTS
jgi:hypothetical protein